MGYSKRQHIIPQFYLKGFAEGKRIQVLDLESGEVRSAGVRDVGVHKDFYTVYSEEHERDIFENWLSGVEGKAAAVIRKVENGTWPLEFEDRQTLAFFMVLQEQRGQHSRDRLERIQSAAMSLQALVLGFDEFSSNLEKRYPGVYSEEDKRKEFDTVVSYQQGDETTFKVSSHQHIDAISQSTFELVKYLTGRPWGLCEFEKGCLITSDEPLGLVPSPGLDPNLGVGLMTASALTFPLNRKLGLYMQSPDRLREEGVTANEVWEGSYDTQIVATPILEKLMNGMSYQSAFQRVFFHPDDSRYVPGES